MKQVCQRKNVYPLPPMKNYVFLVGRFKQVIVADICEKTAYIKIKNKYKHFAVQLLKVV